MHGGVVQTIFQHDQPGVNDESLWAEVLWMKPSNFTAVEGDIWSCFPELDVQFWEFNVYHEAGILSTPPPIVKFKQIRCQLA
ncbi:hypothetical protein JAAARDRAFT_201150 [Jaapia argillacea MUCL 33604]|uniref:Uncharacterized protein n=1 Tax=Jaapia argillacea MUCL 33604 TaxID=933084 RepID=A0A067P5H2_9AGAM|nr:hypothetical protein JAAARDRAFT_201150 [Jaapia argillacea MUCL 33604]